MEITVIILAAVVLVALAALVVCLRRMSAMNAEKTAAAEEKAALANENAVLASRLKSQEETFRALEEQREEARLQIDEERKKAFESQRKQMEESFRLLSEQNSAGLRRQNAESITELLKPIQEKFGEFDRTIRTGQEKAAAQEATMKQMIASLMAKSESVGDEARNLANALAGHSKVQGDFGEMLLVDLLKASGLEEGVHFSTQSVIRDSSGHEVRSESGSAMIPDVIVYYPDDTELIIDSKVSLTAYMNYVNAEGVEDRKRWAREHVASVTRHVDELKTKDYASYIDDGRRKVDYNLMFIPMEGAFRLMLEEAPLLWQRAKDAKVLIVSQMNLMIVLNMILMSWRPGEEHTESVCHGLRAHEPAQELDGLVREARRLSREGLGGIFGGEEEARGFQSVRHPEDRQAREAEDSPPAFRRTPEDKRPHERRCRIRDSEGAGRRSGR